MIKLIEHGHYILGETYSGRKILKLDDRGFVWIHISYIGDILETPAKKHYVISTLSEGRYRIYSVKDEKNLTDLLHLELSVGDGKWQGYLLATGLPTKEDKRNRIIPTNEIITKSFTHKREESVTGIRTH